MSTKQFIKNAGNGLIVIHGGWPYWGLFPAWAMFHFGAVRDVRVVKWMLWWGVN